MQSPQMYNMIRVHCGNLVTVNDSYGPPIPYMEWVSGGARRASCVSHS